MEIVLISFLFGLYWGRYLKNICSFFIILGSIGVILYLQNKKRLIFIFIIISIFAFMYMNYCEKSYDKTPENAEIEMQMKVESSKIGGKYKSKYIAKNKDGKKFYLYVNSKEELNYGDILKVKGKIEKISKSTNEYAFNYSEYLKQKNIYGNIFVSDINLIKKQKIFCIIANLKEKLNTYISDNYSNNSAGFLKALLLGETNEIEKDTKEEFTKLNISHILAISGMHISIIMLTLKQVFQIFKIDKKVEKIILNIFLISYIIFIDCPISALRVVITQIIIMMAFFVNRKSDFLNTISITLFVILVLNPYNIESTAMQLSFGGICGIHLFYKFIKKLFFYNISIKSIDSLENYKITIINIINKIKEMLIDLLCLNISVQIFIFPIVWYNFNFISIISFIPSILISILIFPILILGYLGFVEAIISKFISFKIISEINNFVVLKTLELISFLSKIPLMIIYLKRPSKIFVISYYVILILLMKAIQSNKISELLHIWKMKSGKENIKQYIKVKSKKSKEFQKIIIIIILNIVISFQSILSNVILRNGIEVYFLDVGQGDSTVIKTVKNKTIVIDGGEGENSGFDYGKNILFPFLLNTGTKKIDFLIFSHFDSDHCGGLIYLIENMKVENILIGKQFEKNENFEYIVNLANKKYIKITELQSGNKINIENNIIFEILWPSEKEKNTENAINNNSLVCKFVYKNFSILFTGDIERVAEEELLRKYEKSDKLNSNILKIAHHGSKTSSIQEFLNAVNPQIALIGVGRNNKFGHPNQDVLERLKQKGIQVYRTDINGEIKIVLENNLKIKTFTK